MFLVYIFRTVYARLLKRPDGLSYTQFSYQQDIQYKIQRLVTFLTFVLILQ